MVITIRALTNVYCYCHFILLIIVLVNAFTISNSQHLRKLSSDAPDIDNRPNIIILLADDLGYGDLSVPPFNAHGIKTPELELMAAQSAKLTNFHVAAPICTPSRAAIITGLFPWRLGIYSIFGTGM